jgi:hypothetical protein
MRNPAISLLAAALLALAAPSLATAEQPLPDTADAGVWTTDGPVLSVVTSGDTTYVGGAFSYLGPPTGVAVTVDGAAHATPIGPLRGTVRASVADANGGVYLAGGVQSLGATDYASIVHVRADGTLDPAFAAPQFSGGGNGGAVGVRTLALSGSTLYVGGDFIHAGKEKRYLLAAVDATDGHLLAFDPEISGFLGGSVNALAVGAGGFVYAGGDFDTVGGGQRDNLALLNPQGQLLAAFAGNEPDGQVDALTIQGPDLYVGGEFTKLGASAGGRLRRYALSSDVPDPNWLPAPDGGVHHLATTASTVFAAGSFTHIGEVLSAPRNGVGAVAVSDATATAWDPAPSGTLGDQGNTRVSSLLVAGSTVSLGGWFTTLGGRSRTNIGAVDAVTGAANDWDPSAGGDVLALAATPRGIVAGGTFGSFGGVHRRNLAALGEDGKPTAWQADTDGTVVKLVLGGPDTVYAAGQFEHVNGAGRAHLAALSLLTGTPRAFEPRPDGDVRDLVLSADGATLFVAGQFATIGQSAAVSRPNLAAVSTATGDPSTWRPAPDLWVGKLALAPDQSVLYASGIFDHIGSQVPQPARDGLAAVTLDTARATPWSVAMPVGSASGLEAIGSAVYLAGTFTSVAGQPRYGFAAVSAAGAALLPFDPHVKSNSGGTLARTASGTILIGGSFFGLAGGDRNHLAEVDPATGMPLPWHPLPTGSSSTIAVAGRHVWVGNSGAVGTIPDAGLARFTRPLDPDPAPASGGGAGGSSPTPGPARDATPPALSHVSLTRKRFAVAAARTALSARAARGTALRFTLSEAATVRIAFERVLPGRRAGHSCRPATRRTAGKPRCTRYVAAGTLTRRAGAGAARATFSGRVGAKALRPGRYRLRVVATDAAGNASASATVAFTVVRR